MTSTLNPACPLCGLRFTSRPLLELHIQDDHRPRRREQPDHDDTSGIPASSPTAGSLSARSGLATRPARTGKQATTLTAARGSRPGRVMTVLRRVLRAARHVNDELMLASEAIIRSARGPQAQTHASRPLPSHTVKEPADRAG